MCGALREHSKPQESQRRLSVENFIRPGPLWWVFDWEDARKQAEHVGAPVRHNPTEVGLKTAPSFVFELDSGSDSAGWPNKHYDHRRAGCAPVRTKNSIVWACTTCSATCVVPD